MADSNAILGVFYALLYNAESKTLHSARRIDLAVLFMYNKDKNKRCIK